MLNSSKNHLNKSIRTKITSDYGIPPYYKDIYFNLRNKLVLYNKKLIDDIIEKYGGTITIPMDVKVIETYLTGYEFHYFGFCNREAGVPNLQGYWKFDEVKDNVIKIFYNTNVSRKTQRFTKTHEMFHVAQALDMRFQDFLDGLLEDTILPHNVIDRLLEKSTDKATAMFLMPNKYFLRKFKETQNVKELSDIFQVSTPSIEYRLRELNLQNI